MAEWQIRRGAIVERPRDVSDHPLLAAVYARHDELLGDLGVEEGDRTLELAFGTHPHPDADVGIEAHHENSRRATGIEAVTADARTLPFSDGRFDVVVGRRFLHHVPGPERASIVWEAARVLAPGGRLLLVEGTPGAYRRVTKGLAFGLGLLGEDNDAYGHLSVHELRTLLSENGFDVVIVRSLGSPLLPLGALKAPVTAKLRTLYDRTQWVRWWTLVAAEPVRGRHKIDRRRCESGDKP